MAMETDLLGWAVKAGRGGERERGQPVSVDRAAEGELYEEEQGELRI